MLEIGYNSRFEIRKDRVACAVSAAVRVVYLSDLHFNKRSGPMVRRLVEEIERLKPQLILLGGDYVDSHFGLMYLEVLLQSISRNVYVVAIAGNHDRFFGLKRIQDVMDTSGVQWIEGRSAEIALNGTKLCIDGNQALRSNTDAAVRILCLHKPVDPKTLAAKYQLIFAGHLHGSQCVLWQNERGLFPGRFFYKWNRLSAHTEHYRYYISRGLGDTLPLRYHCPKEIIMVDLLPFNHL